VSNPSPATRRTVTMAVGVVMPVHNEEELLDAALTSLEMAFAELSGWGLQQRVVIVLDSCVDESARVAKHWIHQLRRRQRTLKATIVTSSHRNVGLARQLGCSALLERWADVDQARIWLATTDADSRVPQDWLRTQVLRHEAGVDVWCGRVSVVDWSNHLVETATLWQSAYEAEPQPVHGTSLGFSAKMYCAAGGFRALHSGEDRALRRELANIGAVVHYDSSLRVQTSGRRKARAPLGFAHALNVIGSSLRLSAQG
jgi:glycosyltransferase involved in cell wall biosynthesis